MAGVERGHTALALTDHNTLSGSMEFAQAASSLGLRAIHGAEVDLDDGRHLTLLVRDARGWRNLCRLLTRAHAHTRDTPGRRTSLPPRVSLDDVEEHAEGLVCLSGCARHGVRDEPTMRRLLGIFGRDALPRRAAAPVRPPRPRAQPRAVVAGGAPRRPVRRDGRRPRAHADARAAAGRVRGDPRAHDARRLRAAAARQPRARPRHAAGDGGALRRPSRGGGGDRAPGRHAALRPHPGPRLPLPRRRGRVRRPRPRRGLRARSSTGAIRSATGCASGPPRGWRRSWRSSPASGCRASSSCTATCSSSRARWRSRSAAARPPAGCCRPGAAAAPRCPRSSATSPASRTWTRSRTTSSSGASSTRRSRRCRTSTSTSRATSARS